jgi:SAM-dependent methyltransferase
MDRTLKNLHGKLFKFFLPWIVYPPGKIVNRQFMTFHRLNIVGFLDSWNTKIQGNVLDIGAGTWEYPRKTLQYHCRYMSVDNFQHPNVDLICDIHHLDQQLDTSSWDFILCFDVLEHVLKPSEVVQQAWNLLKPGGIILVTTPFFYSIHSNSQTPDYWRISPEALRILLLELAGFSQVDIQSIGHPKYPFSVIASSVK